MQRQSSCNPIRFFMGPQAYAVCSTAAAPTSSQTAAPDEALDKSPASERKAAEASAREKTAQVLARLSAAGHPCVTGVEAMSIARQAYELIKDWLGFPNGSPSRQEVFQSALREALHDALMESEKVAQAHRSARIAAQSECALAQARLALLQAHFDPDFLFNNLATLQFLMFKDKPLASRMLGHLTQYLRRSTPALKIDRSTLGAEIELAEAYLELAAIRLGGRLRVQISCSEELKNIDLPPMVVHALVDNAIKHGAEPCTTPVLIRVSAYSQFGRVMIDVTDDGGGLKSRMDIPMGVGLRNVARRLERALGYSAKLTVIDRPEGGVLSRIEIRNELATEIGNT